jgi:hypothetical protein
LDGGDGEGKVFAGLEEVAEVGLAVVVAHGTVNAFVEGGEVPFPFFIVDVDDAPGGEEHGVAAVAGGHYAVEHIHAEGNAFEYVPGGAYAHEVAGPVLGQGFAAKLADLVPHGLGLAYA